jgi:hypothetical protein
MIEVAVSIYKSEFELRMSTSSLMRFWILLGLSKFKVLTLFRNVNHEGVDTMLVTVAH